MNMHIGGQAPAAKLIPKPIWTVVIVISRHQVPVHAGKIAHALKRLVERARRQCFHVIDIAGDQYVLGTPSPWQAHQGG